MGSTNALPFPIHPLTGRLRSGSFHAGLLPDNTSSLMKSSGLLNKISVDSSFNIQRINGRKQEITDINDRLGNNWIIAGASWMEHDRAILFSIKRSDKLNLNYDLYRYAFDTRSLKRLTREPNDERWPDWIEGALSVSPHGKLSTNTVGRDKAACTR